MNHADRGEESCTVLLADDEKLQRETLAGFLRGAGYRVLEASDGREALEAARRETVDLVLTDLRMPELDGHGLLRELKGMNPSVAVIVMTAYGTVESAVEAMQAGAFSYLTKPVDLKELALLLDRAQELRELVRENRRLRERLGEIEEAELVARTPEMREVLGVVSRAAPTKASVLITGESGTGKELIARALHGASPRHAGPFVAVNLAAIPEALVESELFGHEKGAFTGAAERRIGRFERADGGTLFIDEVGDMPASAQVKLLRVLQEHRIERVGGGRPIPVDIRVAAATHQPLEELVRGGRFREDLYYRLNVIRLKLPPLRARREDIPELLEHFLGKCRDAIGKEVRGFDRRALDLLMKYRWPGNIRELANAVESAVVLARRTLISAGDLPEEIRHAGGAAGPTDDTGDRDEAATPLRERLESFEKAAVLKALEDCGGNRSKAARRLGLSEKNIRDRLKRWQLG